MSPGDRRPIGVFDSGIGGLSILNALRAALPHERFVYFADTAHAPYGERGEAHVTARSRAIASQLRTDYDIKALVVACNTATAAAIQVLRAEHPDLVLIGVEPALKPAVAHSVTRRIAVLATRGTLDSLKFRALHAALADQAEFILVPCDGLADAIERHDTARSATLGALYVNAAGNFGSAPGQIDTLVLGCTHYPFVTSMLRQHTGEAVRFIDTGEPVAQQTRRLLDTAGLLAPEAGAGTADVEFVSTGDAQALRDATERWLQPAPGTGAGIGIGASSATAPPAAVLSKVLPAVPGVAPAAVSA